MPPDVFSPQRALRFAQKMQKQAAALGAIQAV
jgi:hypothetical protein